MEVIEPLLLPIFEETLQNPMFFISVCLDYPDGAHRETTTFLRHQCVGSRAMLEGINGF